MEWLSNFLLPIKLILKNPIKFITNALITKYNHKERYKEFQEDEGILFSITEIFSFAFILGLSINYIFSLKIFHSSFISSVGLLLVCIYSFFMLFTIKGFENIQFLKNSKFNSQNDNYSFLRYFIFSLFFILFSIYTTQFIYEYNEQTEGILTSLYDVYSKMKFSNIFIVMLIELIILIPLINLKIVLIRKKANPVSPKEDFFS